MIRVLSFAVSARILTLVLSETAILYACYFLAVYVDPDIADIASFVQFDSGLARISVAVGLIIAALYFRNLYAQVRITGRIAMAQELITVFGIAFMGQGLIYYVARDLTLPRKVMLIGSPLALIALVAWRIFFDAAARDVVAARRILFVGMSPAAMELAKHLRLHPELGTFPVGYISDDTSDYGGDLKRLGGFSDLDNVILQEEPRSLVIARREEVRPEWTREFLELDFGGVDIEEFSTLYERTFGRVAAHEAWPPRFVVTDAFEPDETTERFQALYSPVLAAFLLLITSPVLLFVALWVRLSSKGPVFGKTLRAGQNGKAFLLRGFRTEGVPGAQFLRRTGVYRWPALLNVLAGDLAFVGPAPERPEFVERLCALLPFYRQRCRVKPGLTGWEQVHRSQWRERDTLRQLEYDLYYIKNLGPSLDSAVLLLALKAKLL